MTEEQLESIADRTVQEADEDGDGAVSFLEFTKVRTPLGPRRAGQAVLGQVAVGRGQTEGRTRGWGPRGREGMGTTALWTTPVAPQSLEKMNVEQKMSIRILK